jgi:hypothetical protein
MALMQVKPISNAQRTRVPFIINDDINALRRNAEVTDQRSEKRFGYKNRSRGLVGCDIQWDELGFSRRRDRAIHYIPHSVVLAIPLGVLNMLWMLAIVFVILWGAQRFA